MHLKLIKQAAIGTVKFPLMWRAIYMMHGDERDTLLRLGQSFFEALHAIGFMWELAIRGWEAFK